VDWGERIFVCCLSVCMVCATILMVAWTLQSLVATLCRLAKEGE
jgi:hypothetical protein